MNDPRHPVQPAPSLPRTGPGAAPVAPATAPRPPMAHPAAAPAQRIPQAQPAVGLPRVGAPPMARPAVAHPAVAHPAAAPVAPARPQAAPHAHPAPGSAPAASDDDAISLVEDSDSADMVEESTPGPSKIKFGADLGIKKHDWKRQLKQSGGTGATRVRTFHGKLSDQGLEYIDEAINVWLDDHPEIDVKFVTSNVGMFDGKFKDLALIVNVWY